MEYTGIARRHSVFVEKIYSIHYFEYDCTFTFSGEKHDFWEFICVDKGEVNITAGEEQFVLKTGDIFFHEPNEFHSVQANGTSAPNLVVISFTCQADILNTLKHEKLQIDQSEHNLLGKIISEARHCFDCLLDDPYLKTILLKQSDFLGAQQLLFLYLEEFLIHLLRRYTAQELLPDPYTQSNTKAKTKITDIQLFNSILKYMNDNLYTHISIEQICKAHSISHSHLQKVFKHYCNLGVIEYFSYLKIQKAKELIRMKTMNFSQISETLGYSSVQYFSRQFKKISRMTPTEYAASIKAVSEAEPGMPH